MTINANLRDELAKKRAQARGQVIGNAAALTSEGDVPLWIDEPPMTRTEKIMANMSNPVAEELEMLREKVRALEHECAEKDRKIEGLLPEKEPESALASLMRSGLRESFKDRWQ